MRQLHPSDQQFYYRQTSTMSRTLVGNKILDHSDVVGASPVCTAPTNIFILDLTDGFSGLGKDNCRTRRETFQLCDFMWLMLEV